MHDSSCRNIITKPPTQDVGFCDGCDFFCLFVWWLWFFLFAPFPEEAAKKSRNLDCYLRYSADQYAKAPTYWVFANFKSGIDYVPIPLQLWALHPAPKLLLTFPGIYDVSMDFIIVSAPDTKQTASIACFYSCKVWIWESQSSYQACHFSFLDAWLMEVRDSALLPLFPEKTYLHRWTLIVAYILWMT